MWEVTIPSIKFAQNEMMHHVYIINGHTGEGVSEKTAKPNNEAQMYTKLRAEFPFCFL